MNEIRKRAIPRRAVLRGLGAAVSLPWLDAMVPALTALERSAATPPTRLAVVYVPNGIEMAHWTPSGGNADFQLTPILRPLEPFRDRLLVVSGLNNKEAEGKPGDGAGDHSRGPGAFLTGVHIKKTDGADIRAGVSMDQLAAAVIGRDTQLPSLELALESNELLGTCDPGYSCAYSGTIAWRGPQTPLTMENDPRAVFERLFGATTSTDPSARAADRRDRRSLLDSVAASTRRLQRGLGPQDRVRLGTYLDAIRSVESRIQKTEQARDRDMPAVEAPSGGVPQNFEEHAALMFDLLVLALQSDITRVVTFMVAREFSIRTYPESGVPDAHHPLSHHGGNPEKLERLARLNAYHMQVFSRCLERLHAAREADGSLLDHTVLMYGAGMSDGNTHAHNNLPVVVIDKSLSRGGRHIRVPSDTPLMNLHLSVLDRLGVPVDSLGDSTGRLALS